MGMEFDMLFKNLPGGQLLGSALGVAAGVLIAVVVVLALIGLALSAAAYVLRSLGCYKIAKRRGIHNPWLAWIPVGDSWILGSISDQYQYVSKGKIRNRRKALLGLAIASLAVSIPVSIAETVLGVQSVMGYGTETMALSIVITVCSIVMGILAVVAAVIQYIAYYDLFRSCEKDNSVLYLVLSILFSVTLPVFVFICRNKDGGMPPRRRNMEPAVHQIVEEAQIVEEVAEEAEAEEQTDDDAVTEADFEE